MAAAGLSAEEVQAELSGQLPIQLCRPAFPSRNGFVSPRALIKKLRGILPATFEELPKPCAVGVYATKGAAAKEPLLITSGDLPSAVAASCAVPRIFKPVHLELTGSTGLTGRSTGSQRYADGGAVDRTGYGNWREWRPSERALVHLVSRLPHGEFGSRDGVDGASSHVLGIVRTPRAKANFFSLRDFEAQVERAEEAARGDLARLLVC